METIATIDEAGALILPLEIREQLQLKPGDQLKVDVDSERLQVKSGTEPKAELVEKDGLLVFKMPDGIETVDVVEAIRQDREDRDARVLGLD